MIRRRRLSAVFQAVFRVGSELSTDLQFTSETIVASRQATDLAMSNRSQTQTQFRSGR